MSRQREGKAQARYLTAVDELAQAIDQVWAAGQFSDDAMILLAQAKQELDAKFKELVNWQSGWEQLPQPENLQVQIMAADARQLDIGWLLFWELWAQDMMASAPKDQPLADWLQGEADHAASRSEAQDYVMGDFKDLQAHMKAQGYIK